MHESRIIGYWRLANDEVIEGMSTFTAQPRVVDLQVPFFAHIPCDYVRDSIAIIRSFLDSDSSMPERRQILISDEEKQVANYCDMNALPWAGSGGVGLSVCRSIDQ